MGYNIEVSFNIFRNCNVSELEGYIISKAQFCECKFFYSDCEMEKNLCIQRNHKVITVNFDEQSIKQLIKFINIIKKTKKIYIESIYNEETNGMIYASQYYLTLMDKYIAKNYKTTRRERSYSEDDTIIINEMLKLNNNNKLNKIDKIK